MKVVLTLEDRADEPGAVDVKLTFDPPVNLDDTRSPAANLAARCLELIKSCNDDEEEAHG